MAKKRYKYAFTKQKHSQDGKISAIFAGISLGLFCISGLCSLVYHGKGGLYLGAVGLAAMGLSVYGFILGLKSFSEKKRDQFYCKIGAVANGTLAVIWLALFLLGISG